MWTTHKCARLGPDKGTAGIKMEEPIYLHESEVKTKCKKNPYCNSSESSHDNGKTAAAFIIRPEQRG